MNCGAHGDSSLMLWSLGYSNEKFPPLKWWEYVTSVLQLKPLPKMEISYANAFGVREKISKFNGTKRV